MRLEPISDEQLIESLRQDILDQADQIGGLVSELERVTAQRDDIAEAGIRDVRGMGVLLDKVKQQLAASQAEAVMLRLTLKKARTPSRFFPEKVSYCPVCDQGETVGEIEHQPHEPDCIIGQALATPSAAAERVRLLEEVAKAAQKWLAPLSSSLTDSEMAEAIVKQNDALRDAVAALAALNAATGEEASTVEEVKGDG